MSGSDRLDGVRVLVAEPNRDNRELVSIVLERCGATVQSVSSAKDALRSLTARAAPDVVISEISMPDDGLTIGRACRDRRIPAIALTGRGGGDEREAILAAGFLFHLLKPINVLELCAVVRRLTEQYAV